MERGREKVNKLKNRQVDTVYKVDKGIDRYIINQHVFSFKNFLLLALAFKIPQVNKDWIYTTNIYEVNLRQYTKEGTIKAFAKHLNRLKGMGVETLWFMPLTPISEKEKKGTMGSYYACSDYTSMNPEFGTLEEFKQLVVKAHKLGFKVIIDWVANHTGWDHVWTQQHPDWYKKDEATGDFKKASGMDDIIELDYSNVDMRSAMIEAMKFWVNEQVLMVSGVILHFGWNLISGCRQFLW